MGQLGLLVNTVTIAGMIFGEWLARGNSFYSGRDPEMVGSVWRNTLGYSLILLSALVAGAYFLPALLGETLPTPHLLLMAVMVAAVVAQRGFSGILQGRDRLTAFAVIPLVFIGTYFGLNTLGLLEEGVAGVLVAWLVGAAVATLVAAGLSYTAGGVSRTLLQATATLGSRGALSATLIFLLFRSDVFLVEHFLGTEILGVYVVAVVIAEMMQRGPNIAGAVLLPKVLRGIDDGHVMSLAVSRRVLAFSLFSALGVIAVGAPLIAWIYGAQFAGAHSPLVWMLPGLIASGFGSVLNTKLAGQGYPSVTMWGPGAALMTNIGLNLVLIPRYGLTGAALSTSVAYCLWAVIVVVAYQRMTGLAWRQFVRA